MKAKDINEFARIYIKKYLNILGIFANCEGHADIIECVEIAVERCKISGHITQIYEIAGRRLGRTKVAVEKSIRNSLSKSAKENRLDNINALLGYTAYTYKYPLTSGSFISVLADKIIEEFYSDKVY